MANYEKLIANVTALETPYNPSKASLKLPALNTQLTAGKTAIEAVNSAEAGNEVIEISSSQMSFYSRLDNFDHLFYLLIPDKVGTTVGKVILDTVIVVTQLDIVAKSTG